ncbi:hypothetical protein [Flavobacterium sp. N1736]|uniref:hypothetical protein n=1 Tax=Flavobacterium sp. N1736 TaxID=2986823 RepID=UPI00222484A5|nr:hypothetical protein [Flavobacterium sp. N1736]
MKKITTLLLTLFSAISGSAQQIGDGLAPGISNYTGAINSGVYSGFNAIGGIPDTSHTWNHLFVIRHGNPNNVFQFELASSYTENDRLFFRKTSGELNPAWNELATRGTNTFAGNQIVNGNLVVSNSSPISVLEINELSDSRPLEQTAPTKSVLKLSRNGTANYAYPENAEFRIGHGGPGIFGSKLDLYINGGANTNTIPDQHAMTWNYNGNVGIGTTNPKNKLDVKGTIHSQEVKVDMENWSDFVFKKEYNLPTLAEVEKHINEKGHLENIPSEEEVLKNGINLGEMNSKLLQKIEELTLYMIEIKKENLEMKKRLEKIENK